MKRLIPILALSVLLTACHLENFPFGGNSKKLAVKLVTADAQEVDFSSARLEAGYSITDAESEGGLAYFYYSASSADAEEVTPAVLAAEGKRLKAGSVSVMDSTFRTGLTGLDPATLYRFAASILIDGEEFFGEVKSFTTDAKPGEMSVTGKADEITEVSARLSAYAFPAPGQSNYRMGVLCSTEQEPDFNNGLKLLADQMNVKNKYTVMADKLIPDTTYYFRSFLQSGEENHFGEIQRFRTLNLEAQLTTVPSSDIGMYSAVLNGSLLVKSQADLDKEVWFLYGDDKMGDLVSLKEKGKKFPASLGADGSFSGNLSMLQCASTYHYVACAKVYDRVYYGEVQSFTTSDISAQVVTGVASDVGMFSATLSATFTMENTEDIPYSVFFLYIEEGRTEGEKIQASQTEDGSYTCRLSNLKYNTEYQFVAGAVVQEREMYGKVASFKTKDISGTITTVPASEIGLFAATLNGTLKVGDEAEGMEKQVWFLYGKDTSLDSLKVNGSRMEAVLGDDGSFKRTLSKLNLNSEYTFVACARIEDKEFFGKVEKFKTSELLVTVTTGSPSEIGHFSATVTSTLEISNQETVSKNVWFMVGDRMDLDSLLTYGTRYGASRTDDTYWAQIDKVKGSDLQIDKEYYYVACAEVSGAQFEGEVVTFTTKDYPYLPAGDAVDMGLSVKWCSKNLGAVSPEDEGVHIPWGEIQPRRSVSWASYKWADGNDGHLLMKYCKAADDTKWYEYPKAPDGKTQLENEDDIARVKLKEGWRMPSPQEFAELVSHSVTAWVAVNGVWGIRFTSTVNGNSIFLPAAGGYTDGVQSSEGCRYWTQSLDADQDSFKAVALFGDGTTIQNMVNDRCAAFSIRPVTE